MHPLDGARLKVNRAKTEIDRLGLMQDAFFKNTHYSVVRAEKNLEHGKCATNGKKMIKLLKSEHKASIEGLQPYNSSSSPHLKTIDLAKWSGCDSPLFWLEEINNADKHRIIQVAGVKAGGFGTTWWGERDNAFIGGTFGILEDGV